MRLIETFIIGDGIKYPRKIYKNYHDGKGWVLILGYVLKFAARYWGYNSFNKTAYLTDKEHAETFASEESAELWRAKFNLQAVTSELIVKEKPMFFAHEEPIVEKK
jgi:hypothetical protein